MLLSASGRCPDDRHFGPLFLRPRGDSHSHTPSDIPAPAEHSLTAIPQDEASDKPTLSPRFFFKVRLSWNLLVSVPCDGTRSASGTPTLIRGCRKHTPGNTHCDDTRSASDMPALTRAFLERSPRSHLPHIEHTNLRTWPPPKVVPCTCQHKPLEIQRSSPACDSLSLPDSPSDPIAQPSGSAHPRRTKGVLVAKDPEEGQSGRLNCKGSHDKSTRSQVSMRTRSQRFGTSNLGSPLPRSALCVQ